MTFVPLSKVVLLCILCLHSGYVFADTSSSPSLLVLNSFSSSIETTTTVATDTEQSTSSPLIKPQTSLTESINPANQSNIALNLKAVSDPSKNEDDHAKASRQKTINESSENSELSLAISTSRPPFPLNQTQLLNGDQQENQTKKNAHVENFNLSSITSDFLALEQKQNLPLIVNNSTVNYTNRTEVLPLTFERPSSVSPAVKSNSSVEIRPVDQLENSKSHFTQSNVVDKVNETTASLILTPSNISTSIIKLDNDFTVKAMEENRLSILLKNDTLPGNSSAATPQPPTDYSTQTPIFDSIENIPPVLVSENDTMVSSTNPNSTSSLASTTVVDNFMNDHTTKLVSKVNLSNLGAIKTEQVNAEQENPIESKNLTAQGDEPNNNNSSPVLNSITVVTETSTLHPVSTANHPFTAPTSNLSASPIELQKNAAQSKNRRDDSRVQRRVGKSC